VYHDDVFKEQMRGLEFRNVGFVWNEDAILGQFVDDYEDIIIPG
jgi:hypothetical protein